MVFVLPGAGLEFAACGSGSEAEVRGCVGGPIGQAGCFDRRSGASLDDDSHAHDVSACLAQGLDRSKDRSTGRRGVLDGQHPPAGDVWSLDAPLQAVRLAFFANDERVEGTAAPRGRVEHGGGHGVRAESESADGFEVEVGGQVEHDFPDERGGGPVQRHATQVDVVVSLAAGGEDDPSVNDGLAGDVAQQFFSVRHGREVTRDRCATGDGRLAPVVPLALCSSPLTTSVAWGGVPEALLARGARPVPVHAHNDDQPPYALRWVASCALQIGGLPDGPVVLVGHSGAGALLAQLGFALRASHRRVAAYAFVDAGLPRASPGSRLDGFRLDDPRGAGELEELLRSGTAWPNWSVDDLDDIPALADRRTVLGALQPRTLEFWTEELPTPSDFPDAPVVYLQTSAAYDVPARAARAHGWETQRLELGHFPGFVDADALAATLLGMLRPHVPGLTQPLG